jgi:hypothetical protein
MTKELLIASVFGLGISVQSFALIKQDPDKKKLLHMFLATGIGLLVVASLLVAVMESMAEAGQSILLENWVAVIYLLYWGYCFGFAYIFQDKLFRPVNEYSLLALNAILLYYPIAYLGISDGLTQTIFMASILTLSILLRKDLGTSARKFLYCCYMGLYLFIVLKNFFAILPDGATSLPEYFVMGGFFLNIWIYVCYLTVMFGDAVDTLMGRRRYQSALNIAKYFERTGRPISHASGLMLVLTVVLLANFRFKLLSEDLLIILMLLVVDISQRRPIRSGQEIPAQADNLTHQGV